MNEQQRISLFRLLIVGVASSLLVVGGLFLLFAAYETHAWFFWMSQRHLDQDTLFGAGRNAVTLAAALGVGVTLFFSYRKQQTAENAQELAINSQNLAIESQALATKTLQLSLDKHDLERVNELRNRYVRSAEQLASDQEVVRFAGMHSMAALADDWHAYGNEEEQQVCISFLCSYIRSLSEAQDKASRAALINALDVVLSRLRSRQLDSAKFWGNRDIEISNLRFNYAQDINIDGGRLTARKCIFVRGLSFLRIWSGTFIIDFDGSTLVGPSFDHAQFIGGTVKLRSYHSPRSYKYKQGIIDFEFSDCEFSGTSVHVSPSGAGTRMKFLRCRFSAGEIIVLDRFEEYEFEDCTFSSPSVVKIMCKNPQYLKITLDGCKFEGQAVEMELNPKETMLLLTER